MGKVELGDLNDEYFDDNINCSNCKWHLKLLEVDELTEEAVQDGCICLLFMSQGIATRIEDHRYGCEGFKKKIESVVLH